MRYCAQSGNALSNRARFCPKCGAPIKAPTVPVPDVGRSSEPKPVFTCKRASKGVKNAWLFGAVSFFIEAPVMWWLADYDPPARGDRLSAHPYLGHETNWYVMAFGFFILLCAIVQTYLFLQADKYHIEVFEGHVEGLSCCLIGGIREINVPYTQIQGVNIVEKRCALVLEISGRKETMYCPDVDTTRQMRQYINDRIRASYQ